jgi:hypothetical protein
VSKIDRSNRTRFTADSQHQQGDRTGIVLNATDRQTKKRPGQGRCLTRGIYRPLPCTDCERPGRSTEQHGRPAPQECSRSTFASTGPRSPPCPEATWTGSSRQDGTPPIRHPGHLRGTRRLTDDTRRFVSLRRRRRGRHARGRPALSINRTTSGPRTGHLWCCSNGRCCSNPTSGTESGGAGRGRLRLHSGHRELRAARAHPERPAGALRTASCRWTIPPNMRARTAEFRSGTLG